jgi:hypothetical protein
LTGRSPSEAVQRHLAPLQRSLSCITRAVVDVGGGYFIAEHPHTLTIAAGESVPLAGPGKLSLRLIQSYRVIEAPGVRGPYAIHITGYFYGLDDELGREVISFQWHPQSRSPVTTPHLHLGAGARIGRSGLSGSHIPTGRITLEQVLRLAIEDLGVEPLRTDWDSVLSASQTIAEDALR